jgi:hypothetical protein
LELGWQIGERLSSKIGESCKPQKYNILKFSKPRKKCANGEAIALDGEIYIDEYYEDYISTPTTRGIYIDLPSDTFGIVMRNKTFQDVLCKSFRVVSDGHINTDIEKLPIQLRVKLLDVDTEWKARIRLLLAESRESNQGIVTEKMFTKRGKQPLLYNEMKFGSKSEIAIAQALEEKGVLFFPLPLAIRSDTGALYLDHREPDFLICNDGLWGILEVSYHPDRYEKDSEKDVWFKQSGILCIQHYTAERCYQNPSEVVDEFLTILSKYKR